MMFIAISIFGLIALAGFAMTASGQGALKSAARSMGLRDERNGRPVNRRHAVAAASISRQRAFGRR